MIDQLTTGKSRNNRKDANTKHFRTADYRLNKAIFRVIYGDITGANAEVLVSSDDNHLSMGGGVSFAIWKAGGKVIRDDSRKHVPLALGDVIITSAGALQAKYIFHVVTLDYDDGGLLASENEVREATQKCLQLADFLGIKRIAFPALATGLVGLPFRSIADVMTRTIADFLMGDTRINEVSLFLFSRTSDETNLNIFYERAVARASTYVQSKRMVSAVERWAPSLKADLQPKEYVESLDRQLLVANKVLRKKRSYIDSKDVQGPIELISEKIIGISSAASSYTNISREHRKQILQAKLEALKTQNIIHTGNINYYEIEMAKYGSRDAPVRLVYDIESEQLKNKEIEEMITKVESELIELA